MLDIVHRYSPQIYIQKVCVTIERSNRKTVNNDHKIIIIIIIISDHEMVEAVNRDIYQSSDNIKQMLQQIRLYNSKMFFPDIKLIIKDILFKKKSLPRKCDNLCLHASFCYCYYNILIMCGEIYK